MIDPIEAAVVSWLGQDSNGKWWYAIVGDRFDGRMKHSGIECKMDAVEELVAAFRGAIVERINARMAESRDDKEQACMESMQK